MSTSFIFEQEHKLWVLFQQTYKLISIEIVVGDWTLSPFDLRVIASIAYN